MGANYLTLQFTHLKAATAVDYLVEVSGDLVHWYSGSLYTAVSSIVDQGATEVITTRDLVPMDNGGMRYIRLKVIEP